MSDLWCVNAVCNDMKCDLLHPLPQKYFPSLANVVVHRGCVDCMRRLEPCDSHEIDEPCNITKCNDISCLRLHCASGLPNIDYIRRAGLTSYGKFVVPTCIQCKSIGNLCIDHAARLPDKCHDVNCTVMRCSKLHSASRYNATVGDIMYMRTLASSAVSQTYTDQHKLESTSETKIEKLTEDTESANATAKLALACMHELCRKNDLDSADIIRAARSE